MVLLIDDEVYGAAIDGDGSEGGWLARGLRSSAVFNTGAGALARYGEGLLLTAPQSGRFQTRRSEGWGELRAYRLLLNGSLLPARLQIDATHLSIPYVAEDEHGQTDMYVVMPSDQPLPAELRSYLAAQLAGRASALGRAGALAEQASAPSAATAQAAALTAAAERLDATAARLDTIEDYSAAQRGADELIRPALAALSDMLAQARGAALSGTLDQAGYSAVEQLIARIMRVACRAGS
jgi:hypothetical protein